MADASDFPPPSPSGRGATGPGLRNRMREAMRAEVVETAFRLFAEQGFEHTTVDQIAAAAGLSRTTFFRYFGTKEDVVLSHLEGVGHQLSTALAGRPDTEDPWQSLRRAFGVVTAGIDRTPGHALALMRMLRETPSLRARHWEKQLAWQSLLIPEISRRLGSGSAADLRARALAGSALACLDAATEAWTAGNGEIPLPVLLDQAMGTLTSRGAAGQQRSR
jgi:AcrR family transcriptional regulator